VVGVAKGALIALTTAASLLVVRGIVRDAMLGELRNYLARTAATAAAQIDPAAHRSLTDSAQTGSPTHRSASEPLRRLLASNPDIRFAYSGIIRGDSMFYVLDGDATPEAAYVMEPEAPTEGERQVWRTGQPVTEREPSATESGLGIRSYAPLRDSNGDLVGYVGVTMRAEDFGGRVRRVDHAIAIGATVAMVLAALIGLAAGRDEAARQRVEAELIQARDRADAAARAKSQFLSNMSHEIRTPMNGIQGFVDLLGGTSLDARQRRYLDTIHASTASLLRVINDVLDYSSLEAGRLQVAKAPFDFRPILHEVVAMFEGPAALKGLTLTIDDRGCEHPAVLGDPGRFRQVLVNLVGNAIKFTDHGGVVVRVEDPDGTGRALRFGVRDSGIGIAPGELPRIFEAFVQVDGSASRRAGGNGLGLALGRELVTRMGGDLRVASTPGMGSTFSFSLSVAEPRLG